MSSMPFFDASLNAIRRSESLLLSSANWLSNVRGSLFILVLASLLLQLPLARVISNIPLMLLPLLLLLLYQRNPTAISSTTHIIPRRLHQKQFLSSIRYLICPRILLLMMIRLFRLPHHRLLSISSLIIIITIIILILITSTILLIEEDHHQQVRLDILRQLVSGDPLFHLAMPMKRAFTANILWNQQLPFAEKEEKENSLYFFLNPRTFFDQCLIYLSRHLDWSFLVTPFSYPL